MEKRELTFHCGALLTIYAYTLEKVWARLIQFRCSEAFITILIVKYIRCNSKKNVIWFMLQTWVILNTFKNHFYLKIYNIIMKTPKWTEHILLLMYISVFIKCISGILCCDMHALLKKQQVWDLDFTVYSHGRVIRKQEAWQRVVNHQELHCLKESRTGNIRISKFM